MTALAKIEENGLAPAWTDERREFIRKQYCGGAPDDIADAFLQICQRRRLAPEEKHIYLVGRHSRKAGKTEYSIQTGIDGYRLLADRTGSYAGSDRPRYTYDPDQNLVEAEVTVWKLVQGVRCPFTAAADMGEYRPIDSFLWDKMPRVMLSKCAEALALRKAFPAELSGIYVQEEMDQAGPPQRVATTIAHSLREAASPHLTSTSLNGEGEVEVVDMETGEIVGGSADDLEPDRTAAMKRMFAAAKNKLDDAQMKTVVRAAYGLESRAELDGLQATALADAFEALGLDRVRQFVDVFEVLLDGIDEKPLDAAQLATVGESVAEYGFAKPLKRIVRLAYLRAEERAKGARS